MCLPFFPPDILKSYEQCRAWLDVRKKTLIEVTLPIILSVEENLSATMGFPDEGLLFLADMIGTSCDKIKVFQI